jgi:hypothetical protein
MNFHQKHLLLFLSVKDCIFHFFASKTWVCSTFFIQNHAILSPNKLWMAYHPKRTKNLKQELVAVLTHGKCYTLLPTSWSTFWSTFGKGCEKRTSVTWLANNMQLWRETEEFTKSQFQIFGLKFQNVFPKSGKKLVVIALLWLSLQLMGQRMVKWVLPVFIIFKFLNKNFFNQKSEGPLERKTFVIAGGGPLTWKGLLSARPL